MNSQRLGCLSPLALLTIFITLVILVSAEIISGNSMFNPGELNAQAGSSLGGVSSHAEIGKDCSVCHPAFWSGQSMSDLCLDCHVNITQEMGDPTLMHSILTKLGSPRCQSCHTEHHGADAALTRMDLVNFPHEETGYVLDGHQSKSDGNPFTLSDCHTQSISSFDQQTCTDCHRSIDPTFTDAHLAAFGGDCLACHDGVDRYGDFDHTQVSFPLTGQHLQVDCAGCHQGDSSITALQETPTQCEACHLVDDAHAGKFGTQCGVCHSPDGWEPAQFNHSLTDFQLDGKHLDVACENCHANGYAGTPSACVDCHLADDAHAGKFGVECEVCHTTSGWKPANFDHDLADFKLVGKHVEVACESCHTQGFKGTPKDCYSCHAKDDEHQGQFGTDCGTCHNPSDWADATFDHNLAAFQLTGAHVTVRCVDCHANGKFKGTPQECAACHADPAFHLGLFGGMACDQCHSTIGWGGASFNLQHPAACGEPGCVNHEGASCRDCHTTSLSEATCLLCHDSNNPVEGGGGGGDD